MSNVEPLPTEQNNACLTNATTLVLTCTEGVLGAVVSPAIPKLEPAISSNKQCNKRQYVNCNAGFVSIPLLGNGAVVVVVVDAAGCKPAMTHWDKSDPMVFIIVWYREAVHDVWSMT